MKKLFILMFPLLLAASPVFAKQKPDYVKLLAYRSVALHYRGSEQISVNKVDPDLLKMIYQEVSFVNARNLTVNIYDKRMDCDGVLAWGCSYLLTREISLNLNSSFFSRYTLFYELGHFDYLGTHTVSETLARDEYLGKNIDNPASIYAHNQMNWMAQTYPDTKEIINDFNDWWMNN